MQYGGVVNVDPKSELLFVSEKTYVDHTKLLHQHSAKIQSTSENYEVLFRNFVSL